MDNQRKARIIKQPENVLIPNWENFLETAKARLNEKWLLKAEEMEPRVTLSDFNIIKTVGTGSYGRVVLATKGKDEYYAIKILKKRDILRLKVLDHTLNEKRVLQCVDFHFIIKMEYFFKDNSFLFFVMPYIVGGDLFLHLRRVHSMTESASKFYAAQVVLAMEYFHYLKIIYRDLKPENILLCMDGYVKIADLGFCKILHSKTYTMCGTPEYLAPEVMLCKGYGFAADWWTVGILIYELNAGFSPFKTTEEVKQCERTVDGTYNMVHSFSEDMKFLLKGLLQTNPTKRLGGGGKGAEEVKECSWFKSLDWFSLLNKKVVPPFIPEVQGPADTSYYASSPHTKLAAASKVLFEEEFKDF